MSRPAITDQRHVNSFTGGEPLERFVLRVEVKVIASRVININRKLAGLKVRAKELIGGIGAGDPLNNFSVTVAENRSHEPSSAQPDETEVRDANYLVRVVVILPAIRCWVEVLEVVAV